MFSTARGFIFTPLGLCAAALFLALTCAPAWAQNTMRIPVEPPAKAEAKKPKAPVALKITADEDAVDADADNGQADKAAQRSGRSKFPNRDTAKNRQDYEMGTDSDAGTTTLGTDKDSGDTVARYTPPKKTAQQNSADIKTIEVRPIIPLGGRR